MLRIIARIDPSVFLHHVRLWIELGMPMVNLARKFDITPAAVSYAVQRGEKWQKNEVPNWKPKLFEYLRSSLYLDIPGR